MSKDITYSNSTLKIMINLKMQIKLFIDKEVLEQTGTAKYLGIYFSNSLIKGLVSYKILATFCKKKH